MQNLPKFHQHSGIQRDWEDDVVSGTKVTSRFSYDHTQGHADDAIANDVLYHNLCWAKAKRWAESKAKLVEDHAQTLADMKLSNIHETVEYNISKYAAQS